MTLVSSTPAAYLAAFLGSAELVGSSSPTARMSVVDEDVVERSFTEAPSWSQALQSKQAIYPQTAISERAPVLFCPHRAGDTLVAQLTVFRNLGVGWDGERAAKPHAEAIRQAARFARLAGELADNLEPTLHVDGSVILEMGDDVGSFRFKGDGQIIYVLQGAGHGIASFDGFTMPREIMPALGV